MDYTRKPGSGRYTVLIASRMIPKPHRQEQPQTNRVIVRLRFSLPNIHFRLSPDIKQRLEFLQDVRARISLAFVAFVIITAELITVFQPYFVQHTYALGAADPLLSPINQQMAQKLSYDTKQQIFTFNKGYSPQPTTATLSAVSSQITANASQDAHRGISVTDPVNQVSFTLTPQFDLLPGQQDGNRIVYPLPNNTGWVVYTMHGIGIKEDVVLTHETTASMTLTYNLALGDNLAARLQPDGSISLYGNTLLSGNVATATASDAALLQKARQNALKNTLLFSIPAPIIKGLHGSPHGVRAKYALHGSTLDVLVTGLGEAQYPLSIDPSIYVVTAAQFMRGNNETNIDFDVIDKLIQKGKTTGARFNSWTSTTSQSTGVWNGGTVAAGGYVYSVGGTIFSGGVSVTSSSVNWAQFDTSTNVIDSPNPGTGACSGWCTASAYNLPTARAGFSMVAYNGFLYVIGGVNSSNVLQSTVYIAKLGANGEPQLWHPTDPNKANWIYWYSSVNTLPDNIAYGSAVAYNDRLYILGGKSTTNPTGDSIVRVTNLIPTGDIGSWSSTGMTQLSSGASARFGLSTVSYNGFLYVIGGDNAGTLKNDVYYMKLNSDGTMASSTWTQTNSFTTARMTWGGSFAAIWGAYIYLSGGCSVINGSGYCTTVASDTQLASINSDGSIDIWNTNASVSDARIGYGLVTWRNTIYEFGGCSSQNTSTGDCLAFLSATKYGTINQDGDASTVNASVTSGTSPCSGGTPTSCDLPSASVGNVLNETAIMNGYLYIMGGCTNNACGTVSTGVTYQAIASNGTLQKPAACTGAYTDSYCVSSSNLPVGLAAAATAVFGGRIYLVGGFNTGTNIYYISVNTDGSLGAWSGAVSINTVTGGNATTLTYAYAYARANPSSAGTNPGNLYIIGGCTDGSVGCSGYSDRVFKCNIATSGTPSGCTTTGQLQIGTINGAGGTGLGAMAGAVYANYVYLIGGLAPGVVDLKTARYAKFDNNNNIVTVGAGWVEGANQTATGRRRGAGFSYNGYIYVVGGYDGTSGVLADIEFAKINVSNGSWGAFTVSAVTINQRWGLSVPVSNSFAYVIGGCTAGAAPVGCTTRTNTTQTFQIYNNDSGSPAIYSTSANTYTTSTNRIGIGSVILNGYLYIAGGCTSATDCTTAVSDVSYSAIDSKGALGVWSSTTAALPAVRTWGKLETVGGTLYYIGGQDSTATNEQSTIYYGTPSSGNVTTWNTATNALPNVRTKFGAAVWNNRIYVVGGLDGTANVTSTVYVSPQLSAGGNISSAWSTASISLSVARFGPMVVAYANNLYVFGGNDGANYLNDGQYAQINAGTGNSGSWTYTTSLPTTLSQGDAFAANGYMYIINGRSNATTCRPITLIAPISANTTIASGNNPTGVGEWYETNQRYTGDRYGAAAVYNTGKVYVLGGGCGTTLAYGSPVVQQTALLSQPQVAKYSIMIDTDSDVFPNQWLLNGIDNSVGAKWQLTYRSMTNTTTLCNIPAMTTWGQDTNFGNVTLGTPGVYTPLNGSGVNTNCARFFYFFVSVDSSQAYGYPDDVTRGPTITDLTLQFTADPSKRLMHGRTFTGGLQQPDDTPYYAH
jgi:N-acetylneuraminic acid mutarotase